MRTKGLRRSGRRALFLLFLLLSGILPAGKAQAGFREAESGWKAVGTGFREAELGWEEVGTDFQEAEPGWETEGPGFWDEESGWETEETGSRNEEPGWEAAGDDPAWLEGRALLDSLDLSGIETFLAASGAGEEPISFRLLLEELVSGDYETALRACLRSVKDSLFAEAGENGKRMAQIVLLGLAGALFTGFAGVFSSGQGAQAGFYVTYLLIFTLLASCFLSGAQTAAEVIGRVLDWMRALIPAFFLAISFSGGNVASAAGCSWTLFSVSLSQWAFLSLFLPLVRVYVLISLAGHLLPEERFSRLAELLEQAVRWGLRAILGAVLGFHMLQGMIAPYADALKNTSLRRAVGLIPGIGEGASAVSQIVMGTGVLLKNAVGAGAVIVLAVLSAIPLLKLFLLYLGCQACAAVLQPVCDRRLIACLGAAGTGFRLLVSVTGAAVLLFSLSLAVVCLSTNAPYFSG